MGGGVGRVDCDCVGVVCVCAGVRACVRMCVCQGINSNHAPIARFDIPKVLRVCVCVCVCV